MNRKQLVNLQIIFGIILLANYSNGELKYDVYVNVNRK